MLIEEIHEMKWKWIDEINRKQIQFSKVVNWFVAGLR